MIANRADFGGPLAIGMEKLPAGVTLTAEQMEPGLNVIPVVFEAKADAPTGGHLSAITATHADPKAPVPFKTRVRRGVQSSANPARPFTRGTTSTGPRSRWRRRPRTRSRSIEPKVPLVQNGSFNLRVVAKRAAGFKGAITVFPLWTPPGLGIQGSAVIPEGQTECVLPMNAAPNAAGRKWKTAVTAVADAGKGPVWVVEPTVHARSGGPARHARRWSARRSSRAQTRNCSARLR